jgi:hypothetical protein
MQTTPSITTHPGSFFMQTTPSITTHPGSFVMAQSITSNVKQINSQSTVVNRLTTRNPNLESLPKQLFAKMKALQHVEADKIIRKLNYRPALAALLHALINCCDKSYQTRVAQQTLAEKLLCSPRTIIRLLDRLESDGLISRKRWGWKVSNTTVLLFLGYKSHNICDKMSDNLTPSEPPQEGRLSEGISESEKRGPDEPFEGLTAQEADIFDDYIAPSVDFVKEERRKQRELLLAH